MAKIPDVGPRPTPRFAGLGRIQEGGQTEAAVSRLGGAIAGFGEVLAKQKIQNDKYRVEDAQTRLQARMLELSKGDNGFRQSMSGAVVENDKFYEDYMSKYDTARQEIFDSLSNDDQKKMFSQRADVLRIGYNEDLINHITKERSAYNEQVYKGGIANERDIASAHYSNENEVKRALLRTEKLTEEEANRLGLKGDIKKMLLKENKSKIHESVIEQAVDDGNYAYAKRWFEQNQKEILGDRQDDMKGLLRESGIREKSQKAVDEYVAKGLTETEAKAEARRTMTGKERDETIKRIDYRYGEAERSLDREQKAAGEIAWQIYGETKDIDSVPLSVRRSMDGKERVALENKAAIESRGKEVKTDFGTYYGLLRLAEQDPVTFKKLNIAAYRDKLSIADAKSLAKMQTDEKELTVSRTKSQIMKQGAINAGISKKQVKQGFGDEIEKFYQRIDQELEAFQITTGKQPTEKDISEIVNRLSIEVIRDPEAWFFTGERPAIEAEIEGVPPEMVDDLASAVQRAGQPVTDENIRKLYQYLQR